MNNSQELILMYRDFEVLSFRLDTSGDKPCDIIKIIDKLEHFDKAPYGLGVGVEEKENNRILFKFFNGRTIADPRCDYDRIINACGCKDSFELSFKGHGLSLTNHYWYRKPNENLKYANINFFENEWDDSFARNVLKGDYDALSKCDLNVPDTVTDGWAVKGWLCEKSPKLYKLGIDEGKSSESIAEVLASNMANRIFAPGKALKYELVTVNGRYASVSKSMIGVDEELVPLSNILPDEIYSIYFQKNQDKIKGREFFEKISEFGIPELYEHFVKLSCLRSLCFVPDLHFDNISMIRNISTGEMRIAPVYDLAGAFGSYKQGLEFLNDFNPATLLMIYFQYGNIEKDWNYSWYNPDKLVGYEDEIRDYLSKSEEYSEKLIDTIIEVYGKQKEYLDDFALGKCK